MSVTLPPSSHNTPIPLFIAHKSPTFKRLHSAHSVQRHELQKSEKGHPLSASKNNLN
jgi:hypothetical protein